MTPADDSVNTCGINAVIEPPKGNSTGSGELHILFGRVNIPYRGIDGIANTVCGTGLSGLARRRGDDPILRASARHS
jgi:hypothetical protein